MRKYGIENFKQEVLLEIDNKFLDEYEVKFIAIYRSLYPHGYNLTEGGKNHKYSDESRRRMREARLAIIKKYPEAWKEHIINRANKKTRKVYLPLFMTEQKNDDGKVVGYRVCWHPNSPEPKIFIDEDNLPNAYEKAMECYKYLQNLVDGVPKLPRKKRSERTKDLPQYLVEVKHRKTKELIGYGVNGHQFGGKRKEFISKDRVQDLQNAKEYLASQLEIRAQRLNGSG